MSSRTLGLCLPFADKVDAEFAHDLAIAVGYHAATSEDALNIHYRQGTLLAEQRNELCKTALESGATHIISIDTDQRFPKDTFERLMAHDVDIAGANIAKRRRPISATARREVPGDANKLEAIFPDKEVRGLERCHVLGTGVLCIQAQALMRVPYPWFAMPWLEEEQRFVGEDLYFMGLCRQAGVEVYVDHDISWEIGHIGTYVYEMKDVLAEKAMADAGAWDHLRPDMMEMV